MPNEISDKFTPIRKGLLEFAVLHVISSKKAYAAEILSDLEANQFASQEGTLYPLLSKMRREGLVEYEWVESEAGPPRKYYSLTHTGRTQLKELQSYWENLNKTINALGK